MHKLHWSLPILLIITLREAACVNNKNCFKSNPRLLSAEFSWYNKIYDPWGISEKDIRNLFQLFSTRFDRAYIFMGMNILLVEQVVKAAAEFKYLTNSSVQIFYPNIFGDGDFGRNETVRHLKDAYGLAQGINKLQKGTVGGLILQSNFKTFANPTEALRLYEEALGSLNNTDVAVGIVSLNCKLQFTLGLEFISKLGFVICDIKPRVAKSPEDSADLVIAECDDIAKTARERNVLGDIFCRTGYPTTGAIDTGVVGNVGSFGRFWCRIAEKIASDSRHTQIIMQSAFDESVEVISTKSEHKYSFGWWRRVTDESSDETAFEEKVDDLNDTDSSYNGLVVGLVVCVGILIGVLILSSIAFVRYLTRQRSCGQNAKMTSKAASKLEANTLLGNQPDENDLLFEIPKSCLTIDTSIVLGKGEYGIVYSGSMSNRSSKVAIKTTKVPSPFSATQLLAEIKILIHVGKHQNVLELIGANTAHKLTGIIFIVLELCEMGSLQDILRKRETMNILSNSLGLERASSQNSDSISQLAYKWSYEIACGMLHISTKNVVHADLAARNVLVTRDGVAKITDFGLSRKFDLFSEYIKQQQGPLPWRWMAPESLRRMAFSTESDVWSFGITLYEIFSEGSQPYPGIAWDNNFVDTLETGYINSQPQNCPDEIYAKLKECWHLLPPLRPTFSNLQSFFETFLQELDHL